MPKAPDAILRITGPFGRYQFYLCALIFLSKFAIAWHQMAIIFLAPKIKYTCGESKAENVCPCKNPTYNTSVFKSTIMTEWNLICDKRWMVSLNQTLFQFGTLLGSMFFGMAADKFGRRLPFLFAVAVQISMGILAYFLKNYWLFAFVRFLIGVSVGGTMVIGFVIIMEFIGPEYREVVSALYQTPFNMGHMTLPIIGYFFRNFRDFQLAISLPTLIFLLYFIFVPETPRWLLAAKRVDAAEKILERVAKFNNRPTDNIKSETASYLEQLQKSNLRKGTIVDLVRTPNLRKNTICMAFNWLTCSYCFYGVSQYVGQLSGNVFANVGASACVTFSGTLLSIPLLKAFGRKALLIVFNFSCAACLFILIVIPEGIGSVIFACIGVVTSFILFVIVYLYCSELFPTVVRNAAVGFSSMMARVGSMIAPFVVDAGTVGRWCPPLLFALIPLTAGGISFFLPETKGFPLMSTLEEGENFGKKTTGERVVSAK